MVKLLDSTKITTTIQKVVEAGSGLIINGHYYDKTTMAPRPLKLIQTNGNIEDLAMNKRIARAPAAAMWQKSHGDTVIVDRYDPTITYVCNTNFRANTIVWYKLREQNGNVDQLVMNVWGAIPTTSPFLRQVIGQDANYLYVLMETATYGSYMGKVDKTTMVYTNILTVGAYCSSNGFKETDTHIFFAAKKQYGTSSLNRYNKVTGVMDTIPVTAKTGGTYAFTTCYSEPIVVSDTELYLFELCYNATTQKFYVVRNKLDTTQNTLTSIAVESTVNITWGSITQFPVPATAYANKFELFVTTGSNGKQYLNVALMEATASSTAALIPSSGIYTFLIDPVTRDLTFKNFVSVTPTYFRQFGGVRKNTFLVCMTDDSTIFMNFDEAAEKFVQTDILSNQPSHIGIDQSENVWIINAQSEVDMLSPYVPTVINVAFEKSSYKYEGVDFESFITIEAKNYSGVNIAVNLDLALKGNLVFKSTGTKALAEPTLVSGPKVIPVIIKGSGNFSIFPKLIM